MSLDTQLSIFTAQVLWKKWDKKDTEAILQVKLNNISDPAAQIIPYEENIHSEFIIPFSLGRIK